MLPSTTNHVHRFHLNPEALRGFIDDNNFSTPRVSTAIGEISGKCGPGSRVSAVSVLFSVNRDLNWSPNIRVYAASEYSWPYTRRVETP